MFSHPGCLSLFSGDDFYLMSSGLLAQETTIGNSNPELNKFITPQSVLEWMRNIVANRLAVAAPSWADYFSLYNSGTYNNQWMIFDYNLFVPQQSPLAAETFLLVEQIPGTIKVTDVTSNLENNRFFGSYNVAFDPEIRNLSGVDALAQLYGDAFSYANTPRGRIFQRDQSKISTCVYDLVVTCMI